MERKNMVIDVAPFLLIEATGDSEADSDPAMTCDPGLTSSPAYDGGGGGGGGGGGDGEDAESCSGEWFSDEQYDNRDVRDSDCGDTEAYDGTDESDDRRRWMRETGNNERVERRRWPEAEGPCASEEINSFDEEEAEEINKKPSGIASSEAHLSETEKSRLFWEACLAS